MRPVMYSFGLLVCTNVALMTVVYVQVFFFFFFWLKFMYKLRGLLLMLPPSSLFVAKTSMSAEACLQDSEILELFSFYCKFIGVFMLHY